MSDVEIPQLLRRAEPNEADYFVWLSADENGAHREIKPIGNGLFASIKPLLFHWTLIVGEVGNYCGYLDRWCYADQPAAETAIRAWSGEGEPAGWFRHPATGRRRHNGAPATETIAP